MIFFSPFAIPGGRSACFVCDRDRVPEIHHERESLRRCRITDAEDHHDDEPGGFGGLFSLTFASSGASRAFFDALPFQKGPSLRTNFVGVPVHDTGALYGAGLGGAVRCGRGLGGVGVGMEMRHS